MRNSLLAAFLLFVPALAHAQGSAPFEPDGKVQVDDARIAEALRGAVGQGEISEAIARMIGPAMYADNQLTRNESDLFRELLYWQGDTVEVTAADGGAFMAPAASQGARDFLALSDVPDINLFWLTGPEQMKKLVDVTVLNPHVRDQVQHYIANQLYLRWQTSSFVNGYSPLRDTLSVAFVQWRDAGPETLAVARELLYDALVELDMAVNDDVPDDFYERLRS